MKTVPYIGGPLDQQTYPLESGQPIPTEIRHSGWRHHYVLKDGRFVWTGK